jgi:phytoene dehydrogenase-like protein
MTEPDAIVVGAGPNGLAAAVTLARAGLSVRVLELGRLPGGGARTEELTLPGFLHDVCSAVHPMALASEFFRRFGLADRVPMLVPEISYGHPLPGGGAGIAYHDLERTVDALGPDGPAWRRLFGPLLENLNAVRELTGNQLLRVPRHPVGALLFGLRVLEQGSPLWNVRFRQEVAPALLTGVFAHTIRRLPSLATAGAGLTLATQGHAGGWPVPVGGSQAITDAMVDDLVAHGGELVLDTQVRSLAELPPARVVMLDVTPRALLELAGDSLPSTYAGALRRFRYGNGVAKVDFALSAPVPWQNQELRKAATLHLGGTRAQIARAENTVARGRHAEEPYVLVSQPTVLDPTRAPAGSHLLWTYTHVPSGSTLDQTESIIRQVERFAPGFRDTILATSSRTAEDVAAYDPNDIGGDIAAGAITMWQLVKRPVLSTDPWRTPLDGVYLCSASTPPGPGVHGLAGWNAALSALRTEFGRTEGPELGPSASAPSASA